MKQINVILNLYNRLTNIENSNKASILLLTKPCSRVQVLPKDLTV